MSDSCGAREPRQPESESGLEIDESSAAECIFTRNLTADGSTSPAAIFHIEIHGPRKEKTSGAPVLLEIAGREEVLRLAIRIVWHCLLSGVERRERGQRSRTSPCQACREEASETAGTESMAFLTAVTLLLSKACFLSGRTAPCCIDWKPLPVSLDVLVARVHQIT